MKIQIFCNKIIDIQPYTKQRHTRFPIYTYSIMFQSKFFIIPSCSVTCLCNYTNILDFRFVSFVFLMLVRRNLKWLKQHKELSAVCKGVPYSQFCYLSQCMLCSFSIIVYWQCSFSLHVPWNAPPPRPVFTCDAHIEATHRQRILANPFNWGSLGRKHGRGKWQV